MLQFIIQEIQWFNSDESHICFLLLKVDSKACEFDRRSIPHAVYMHFTSIN